MKGIVLVLSMLMVGCACTNHAHLTQSQIDVLLSMAENKIDSRIENLEQALEWYRDPVGIMIDHDTDMIMRPEKIEERMLEHEKEIERLKSLLSKLMP
jgi:hypothetical protein